MQLGVRATGRQPGRPAMARHPAARGDARPSRAALRYRVILESTPAATKRTW